MVHAVNIIDSGGGNIDVTVFLDAMNGRNVNVNSLRNLLPGNQRNNPAIVSAKASDYLQMLLDVRMLLSDHLDDPDFSSDPALPHFFHAREVSADNIGSGQNIVRVYRPVALVGGTATHIIAREALVTVTWDGTTNAGAVQIVTTTPPSAFR